jgi:hypothetical protein
MFAPRCGIGLFQRQPGICVEKRLSFHVRVIKRGSRGFELRSTDTALAGAIVPASTVMLGIDSVAFRGCKRDAA